MIALTAVFDPYFALRGFSAPLVWLEGRAIGSTLELVPEGAGTPPDCPSARDGTELAARTEDSAP